jgi:hypothetical protein
MDMQNKYAVKCDATFPGEAPAMKNIQHSSTLFSPKRIKIPVPVMYNV